MLTGGANYTATDKTDITEVNDIVTSELKNDITCIRDVSELNAVIVHDVAPELDDTMLDDLEFVKAHGYIQSEVCWICKDPFSSVPTIEPCYCPPAIGLAHPACLINWMNTYCKGRCPRCAEMFRVKTEQKPRSMWQTDPLFKERKTKYIMMVTLNLTVTLVCFVSIGHLLSTERSPERIAIAAIVGVIYCIYIFYLSRLYVRIYERIKIYNNKVVQVFDKEYQDGADERHNLSSYIDQSELY